MDVGFTSGGSTTWLALTMDPAFSEVSSILCCSSDTCPKMRERSANTSPASLCSKAVPTNSASYCAVRSLHLLLHGGDAVPVALDHRVGLLLQLLTSEVQELVGQGAGSALCGLAVRSLHLQLQQQRGQRHRRDATPELRGRHVQSLLLDDRQRHGARVQEVHVGGHRGSGVDGGVMGEEQGHRGPRGGLRVPGPPRCQQQPRGALRSPRRASDGAARCGGSAASPGSVVVR